MVRHGRWVLLPLSLLWQKMLWPANVTFHLIQENVSGWATSVLSPPLRYNPFFSSSAFFPRSLKLWARMWALVLGLIGLNTGMYLKAFYFSLHKGKYGQQVTVLCWMQSGVHSIKTNHWRCGKLDSTLQYLSVCGLVCMAVRTTSECVGYMKWGEDSGVLGQTWSAVKATGKLGRIEWTQTYESNRLD